MAGRTTGLGVPTQGSSGLLRDTKPNSNYTSKSSSTKAYTTWIVGSRRGTGYFEASSEVGQRDTGSSDARFEVSVHKATQAEWSLMVAKSRLRMRKPSTGLSTLYTTLRVM